MKRAEGTRSAARQRKSVGTRRIPPLSWIGLTVLAFAGLLLLDRSSVHAPAEIGSKAPALELRTVAGRSFGLSGVGGAGVVVNFWATWCAPCQEELPELSAAASELAGCGVKVLGVASDSPEAEVKTLAAGLTYPVLVDDSGRATSEWGVKNLPTTFVVDRTGVVRAVREGALTRAEVLNAVRSLSQPSCPP